MPRAPLFAALILISYSQAGTETVALRSQETSSAQASIPEAYAPRRIDARHLPNVVQVHKRVLSGGVPAGDEAFRRLQSMGVKTVISVDAQKPDAQRAVKYGLRYVHLPHSYDGVPFHRVQELAKAIHELGGPFYLHCHHGKHRSPAAAAVACVAAGLIPQAEGVAVLELAGTSPKYRGLFESVRTAKPLEKAMLDRLQVEFRETVEVPPIATAMVNMARTYDHLMEITSAGWRPPTDHPDLDPAHEALLLREHFSELLRTPCVQQKPAAFQEFLRDSEDSAQALEVALREWQPATSPAEPPATVLRSVARIAANCKGCHERFRDIPLSVK